MKSLLSCSACHGFNPEGEARCLHCDAFLPRSESDERGWGPAELAKKALGAGLVSITLMACYAAMPVDAEEGASCASSSECRAGLECSKGHCEPIGKNDCRSDAECGSGYYCAGGSVTVGTCEAKKGVASTCGRDGECHSGGCSMTTRTCGDNVSNGSACSSDANCRSGMCGSRSHTCVARPDSGCTSDDHCSQWHICNTAEESCMAPTFPAKCLRDVECSRGKCDTAKRECALLPSGSPCERASVCESGVCDPSTKTCTSLPVAADGGEGDALPLTFDGEAGDALPLALDGDTVDAFGD